MNIRFNRDPETGLAHILSHGVSEEEAREVFAHPVEDGQARNGARAIIGRTRGGRIVRLVYINDPEPESVFVITGMPVRQKALKALRRRMRRRMR
jgi:hypothetical protein